MRMVWERCTRLEIAFWDMALELCYGGSLGKVRGVYSYFNLHVLNPLVLNDPSES